jgi:hypothetical protein
MSTSRIEVEFNESYTQVFRYDYANNSENTNGTCVMSLTENIKFPFIYSLKKMKSNNRQIASFFVTFAVTIGLANSVLPAKAENYSEPAVMPESNYMYRSEFMRQFKRDSYLSVAEYSPRDIVVSDRTAPYNRYQSWSGGRSGLLRSNSNNQPCVTIPRQGKFVWAAKCVSGHSLQSIQFVGGVNSNQGYLKWTSNPQVCLALAEEGKVELKPCDGSYRQLWRRETAH